jgi:hypothetical protein
MIDQPLPRAVERLDVLLLERLLRHEPHVPVAVNARDAATKGTPSIVEASLENDWFTFRHNGAPFRDEEIAHLIYYGSTKRGVSAGSSDPIGRFGSGFLTPHLLAKQINVSGRLHDGRRFKFVLNRQGASPDDLSRAMDKSRDEFTRSLAHSDDLSKFTTEYRYPLSSAVRLLAESGVSALEKFAPYTLAFNPQLRELRIVRAASLIKIRILGVLDWGRLSRKAA